MITKPLVFISSTSDFKKERKSLRAQLRKNFVPYLYEWDRAGKKNPKDRCREKIEQSELFIGVLGPSFGSPLPGEDETKSIVAWEFETAMSREDLEIMPFVKIFPLEAVTDPRQRSFLNEITSFEGGSWCKFFDSPKSLVSVVRDSVEEWLVEFLVGFEEKLDAEKPSRAERAVKWLGMLTGPVMVLAYMIFAFSPLGRESPPVTVVMVGIVVIVLVVLSMIFSFLRLGR